MQFARLSPGKALTLTRIDFTSSGAHVLVDIDIVGLHGRGSAICRPRTYIHAPNDQLAPCTERWQLQHHLKPPEKRKKRAFYRQSTPFARYV